MKSSPGHRCLLALFAALFFLGCREDAGEAAARRADAVVAHSTGLGFLRRDQLPEAEAEFQKVVELAPRDPIGHANLGLTYLRGGRYEDAERHLDRARRLAPDRVDVALTLARLYSLTERAERARQVLEDLPGSGPDQARVLYALAELEAQAPRERDRSRRKELLEQVLALETANLAVRLELVDIAVGEGDADRAIGQLEEIRRLPPELPVEAREGLEKTILALRGGRPEEARASLDRVVRIVQLTVPYQAALEEVKWVEGPLVGRPILTFEPQSLIAMLGTGFRPSPEDAPRFVDVTRDAGLPEPGAPSAAGPPAGGMALALGDVYGDGVDDLFAGSRLYGVQGGYVFDITDRTGIALDDPARLATFADVDNDGWLDLFVVTEAGDARLLRNTGGGTLENVAALEGTFDATGATHAEFVDLDHDGDLDLLLAGTGRRLVYRNNLDGTFTESAESMGLAGAGDARSVRFADFDDDGRIDVFISHADVSDLLYRNQGGGRFADVTAESGLATSGGSGAAAVGDYDNDGFLDLVITRVDGRPPVLMKNGGDGTFSSDDRSAAAMRSMTGLRGAAAEFVDIDNDGWLDLVVAGTPSTPGGRGVFLLRNDGTGRFEDHSTLLAPTAATGSAIVVGDVDEDGDQDLLIGGPAGVHLLRNEGGNSRMASRIQLAALRSGSGKNNTFGIGSRIELRAGELFQTRVVTGRNTHFGLGPHLKADVVRIVWPNGVPQTVYLPGTDEDVLELEHLKGSCPFLYAWDGTGFRFVTDVMWRSALGMPVGIMGGGGRAYAPAAASQEYLRIPGSALQPRNGRYVLQLTEELWETAYVDEVKLLAVDHPDSVQVFVDERFVPPAPTTLRLFPIVNARAPRSAVDGRGNDVLPALLERDDTYVSGFTPLDYQGLVEPHDLVLDFGEEAGRPGTSLFLRGWIYPTDASINVALSQRSDLSVIMPRLEVRDARGRWTTAISDVGFPSGKDKTIVIDLAGIFPTSDRHVRIRTNLQIYWDHAFVATEIPAASVRVREVERVAADLHFRGYSRMHRKGGRYGPHWFDYDSVSREHPWRPIEGAFTNYGDVLPLLEAPDDMYVIMAPGDEMTVEFDATSASAPPRGWTRTFLMYTVGWIKDADMNTAFGNTVEPLPFHGIREYPYAAGESYPTDTARQRYHREFNSRVVRRR
ncbi:MAG TPA: FG-GAP-like repeat-containing protein [Gemmatimonadaceae bacterium]|nr:FG-GAP-like repeat-containing protein [Gemmatimonadaceae bacterium]